MIEGRPVLNIPMPPDVVNLVRQTDGMNAMALVRRDTGLTTKEMCDRAGITTNSAHAWTRGGRSPILPKFVQLADVHGYEVELVDDSGEVTNLRDQKACIERINKRRLMMGIGLYEMEIRAGVSFRSFYAWRHEHRHPSLANIVALAETFGFSIVMRRVL